MTEKSRWVLLCSALVWFGGRQCPGQEQATVSVPLTGVSERFCEHIGTGFSVRGRHFHLSFGGPGTFGHCCWGGSHGLHTGLPLIGHRFGGGLFFHASQCYSYTLVTQTPILTIGNGVPVFVFGGAWEPFVLGWQPIIAGWQPGLTGWGMTPPGRLLPPAAHRWRPEIGPLRARTAGRRSVVPGSGSNVRARPARRAAEPSGANEFMRMLKRSHEGR